MTPMPERSENVQKVKETLQQLNHPNDIIYLADDARTAQQAADGLGCQVEQIAKSIIFRLASTENPLLVVTSGRNRVNEQALGKRLNDQLESVDATYVREATGFVIGGVSPVGHTKQMTIVIDEDLFQYETIWAAAGHPKAVFELTPKQLKNMTNGDVLKVTK